MIKKGKELIKHPLFSGSAIMIVGSNLANFFAYLYHLVIGRLLGPESYGELVSIISFYGMITAAFGFLGVVVVKFSSAVSQNKAAAYFKWFSNKALMVGAALAVVFLAISPFVANFLHVPVYLVAIVSPLFFLALISLTYKSFLQGRLKFKESVISGNVDIFLRLVSSALLVFLGLSVLGALGGFIIASVTSILLMRVFLREYRNEANIKRVKDVDAIMLYAMPILISSISTSAFYLTDVLLVKHFFTSQTAGIYGSVSNLGKIIYFGTAPIAAVMFPLVSQRHAKKQNFQKIFFSSLALTFVVAVGVVLVYSIFPKLMVTILYGKEYLEATKHIVRMGVFMTIYAMGVVVINFFLSINKTKVVIIPAIGATLQVVLIFLFHQTIDQVINMSIISGFIMFLLLLGFYANETKKVAQN